MWYKLRGDEARCIAQQGTGAGGEEAVVAYVDLLQTYKRE
jgi:hypothetical protein